jgi:hypothetical protein
MGGGKGECAIPIDREEHEISPPPETLALRDSVHVQLFIAVPMFSCTRTEKKVDVPSSSVS